MSIVLLWLLIATNGMWWVFFTSYHNTVKREVRNLRNKEK